MDPIRPIHRHGPTWGLFTAATVMLIAVSGFLILCVERFVSTREWVTQSYAVLTELGRIAALKQEAVLAQHGYLLTQDPRDRTQFWDAKAAMPLHLQSLREMVRDDSEQTARLAEIEPRVRKRLALATQSMEWGGGRETPTFQTPVDSTASRTLDNEIQALLQAMRAHQERLLEQRNARVKFGTGLLLLAGVLGIPLSLLMLGMIYRLLVRENAERRKSEQHANAVNLELNESVAKLRTLSVHTATMSQYVGILQGCGKLQELLDITCQTMSGLIPKIAGTIFLIRSSRDHAEAAAQWGQHRAQSSPLPLPSECWALRLNQSYFCHSHRDVKCPHVEWPSPDDGGAATACLPLTAQGESMGWFYLSGEGPGPLPDVNLAMQAAEQFSLALANIRLKEKLRDQSIRDPLTGLFNRRYLEESLTREISRCHRHHSPLTVLMFDLDHFKAFNDLHGHPGGDTLLAAFGRLLQSSCRQEDIACRYGGEEFTLILPETDETIGLERANQLLAATSQLTVSHQSQPLSRITTSIGLAVFPKHGSTSTSLLMAADRALYRAKTQGRNRIYVASLDK